MIHVLAAAFDPWSWSWIVHTPVVRQLYHTVAWTWGGAGQGGQSSEAYAAFSSSIPCLALISLVGNWAHSHQCHEHHCLRPSWHPDSDGHPLCKTHHPDHPSRGWFRSDRAHPRHARNRQ